MTSDATQVVLFSDPNCPFCYATEERLHATGLAERVIWCGVEHAPELPPTPMAAATGSLAQALPAEVKSVQSLAPEIPIAVPPGKPNTRNAIEHGAAALRADPVRGRDFVRELYRAFWQDGTDISDPAELGKLATVTGLPELEPTPEDAASADHWHALWARTGLAGVPALVRSDGRALYGLESAETLREFLS